MSSDVRDPCEPPVPEGYIRIYEFLHGWEDIPVEEYNRQVEETKNDPLYQLLQEEVQKEINREVVRSIEDKIRMKG